MSRLPTVGGDAGNWGEVLNDYLSQSHTTDGKLRLDIATIAALKALDVSTIPDKMQVMVGGYYAHGDGGGGQFYYDQAASDTDNGGTIIAPTAGSGRWKRIYSGAINVRWFGAKGDGVTDDTSVIRNAIASISSGGSVFFPKGTYSVTAASGSILTGVSGVTFLGDQAKSSILKVAASSAATSLLNLSGKTDVVVTDLGFDGNSNATTKAGVYVSTNGTQKNLTVQRCRFTDFMPGDTSTTFGAIYTWSSDGIHILNNEFVGCGRAINCVDCDGVVNIVGNRITATPGASLGLGTMATGIILRRASGSSEGKVLIQGNYVRGATLDAATNGAEGHGIVIYRTRGVSLQGNHCVSNARGILVSNLSFEASVIGNVCVGNWDAGIRCEPEISSTNITIGTAGAVRGITVSGNVCYGNTSSGTPTAGNYGIGITLSYAAGSVVQGNVCHDNSGDGISSDSDRVSIIGNTCFNNWKLSTPASGSKGGIRVYGGSGNIVSGNICFDNQTVKTQEYGVSVGSGGHVVINNSLSGNSVGDIDAVANIRQGFFGANPVSRSAIAGTASGTDATILNNLLTALRNIGVIG